MNKINIPFGLFFLLLLSACEINNDGISNLMKPSNVKVSFTGNNSLILSWTDGSTTEAGYRILRENGNNGFLIIANLPPNSNKYVDSSLDTSFTYSYEIQVYDNKQDLLSDTISIKYVKEYTVTNEFSSFSGLIFGNVSISGDGQKIAVTGSVPSNNVKIFNLIDSSFINISGHVDGSFPVCFDKDGKTLATGGYKDRMVRIWNVNNGNQITEIDPQLEGVYTLCFSNNNQYLAVGGFLDYIRIYNINDWSTFINTSGNNVTRSLIFNSNDTKMISAGNDNTVKLWDFTNGSLIRTFSGHTGHVGRAVINNDESIIISGSYEDNSIKKWNSETGYLINSYTDGSSIAGLNISADGEIIDFNGAGTVRIIDLNTFCIIQSIQVNESGGLSMDYCLQKDIIVCLGIDGKVKVLRKVPHWIIFE